MVSLGLLNQVKGRWACLPLVARFTMPMKMVNQQTTQTTKTVVPFQRKLDQAVSMLSEVADFFKRCSILVVCDNWFGNNGLLQPARKKIGPRVHLLSRLRSNTVLHALPELKSIPQQGRPNKYGQRLGSSAKMAAKHRPETIWSKHMANTNPYRLSPLWPCSLPSVAKCGWCIELYAARWKIEASFKDHKQEIGSRCSQIRNPHAGTNHLNFCSMAVSLTWIYAAKMAEQPQRRHQVKGRASFAFSDIQRSIAQVILSKDFAQVCPVSHNPVRKGFASMLLGLAA